MKSTDHEFVLEYLRAALDRDGERARMVIERMLELKLGMSEIFGVLAGAQVEIGEMWAKGVVSVADEHFATDTTLKCIDLVSERLNGRGTRRRGLAFLCTVEGEYHLVGLRMFAELLGNQGWHTIMLGSNFSAGALVERAKALRDSRVDLLCVSATMPSCLSLLVETLRRIRTEPIYERTKIVAGGPAFRSRKARSLLSEGPTGKPLADYVAWKYDSALRFTGSLAVE